MIGNFRDLGGYQGKDGRRVRQGLLYRSGNLNLPSDYLAQTFEARGISLVFDLRSGDEVANEPYVLPEAVSYRHRPVLSSLEADMRALNQDLYFDNPGPGDPARGGGGLSVEALDVLETFMPKIYQAMGEEAAVFGDIIREILDYGESPLLFHCSAGKDRTGILATMILLALGVSQEEVLSHYMLSNHYRQAAMAQERADLEARVKDPELMDKIEAMLVVKEEYLEATLKVIQAYPDFEAYAQDKMGLGPDQLESLRVRYLED